MLLCIETKEKIRKYENENKKIILEKQSKKKELEEKLVENIMKEEALMKLKLQQSVDEENDNIFKKTLYNKQMNEMLLGERDVINLDVPRHAATAGAPVAAAAAKEKTELYKGPSHVSMFLNQRMEPKLIPSRDRPSAKPSREQVDSAGGYQYMTFTRRNWSEVLLALKYVHGVGDRLPKTFPRTWE